MTSATGEATMDVRVRPEKDEMGETVVDEARVKMSLFVHKAELNLDLKITQEDVMPLLNRMFQKSCNCVESNLCAPSERGCNPPAASFWTIRISLEKNKMMVRNNNQPNKLIAGHQMRKMGLRAPVLTK